MIEESALLGPLGSYQSAHRVDFDHEVPLPAAGQSVALVETVRVSDPLPLVLAEAVRPVFDDLARTSDLALRAEPDQWSDYPGQVTAMLWAPDSSGAGISVMDGERAVDQVVVASEQVQEVVIKALWTLGRPAVWPECPTHPDTHPLRAHVQRGEAVWMCPADGTEHAAVGALPTPRN